VIISSCHDQKEQQQSSPAPSSGKSSGIFRILSTPLRPSQSQNAEKQGKSAKKHNSASDSEASTAREALMLGISRPLSPLCRPWSGQGKVTSERPPSYEARPGADHPLRSAPLTRYDRMHHLQSCREQVGGSCPSLSRKKKGSSPPQSPPSKRGNYKCAEDAFVGRLGRKVIPTERKRQRVLRSLRCDSRLTGSSAEDDLREAKTSSWHFSNLR
jgi:hypothetical protein